MDKQNTLSSLLEAIGNLQQAQEILEQIFVEVGPHQSGVISKETMIKLCRYMKFDDSE